MRARWARCSPIRGMVNVAVPRYMLTRAPPPDEPRFLVVEDQEWAARIYARVLAGAVVDVVDTLAKGRAAVAATNYSAVIIDIGLPDGDGRELVRELIRTNNTRCIIVSGTLSDDSIEDLIARGVTVFAKPADLLDLRRAVGLSETTVSGRCQEDDLIRETSRVRELDRAIRELGMTPKEHAVVLHALDGRDANQSAVAMKISVQMVQRHRTRVARKYDRSTFDSALATIVRRIGRH